MKRNSRYSFMKVADFGWDCFEFYYHLIRLERAKIWNCIKYVNSAEEFSLLTAAITDLYPDPVHRVCTNFYECWLKLAFCWWLLTNFKWIETYLISSRGWCLVFASIERKYLPRILLNLKTLSAPAGSVVWFYLQLQSYRQSSAWCPGMLMFN